MAASMLPETAMTTLVVPLNEFPCRAIRQAKDTQFTRTTLDRVYARLSKICRVRTLVSKEGVVSYRKIYRAIKKLPNCYWSVFICIWWIGKMPGWRRENFENGCNPGADG